jgi:dolichol-phosphate mannosyltransferase
LLRRVAAGPYHDKEVLVIDDGSSDATPRLLEAWADRPGFRVLRHAKNQGKGTAVRTGLAHARGEVTIIQDADLEYDPADYTRLVEPIRRGEAEVVYGSRYLAPTRRLPWTKFRVGVMVFNGMVRVLYGQRTTDEATCYKAVRTSLFRALDLQAVRFELCPEMTAKLCRLGCTHRRGSGVVPAARGGRRQEDRLARRGASRVDAAPLARGAVFRRERIGTGTDPCLNRKE